MRPSTLLREALAATWAAKVPSLLILVVAVAMGIAPILTVGRSAAAVDALQQRMEQAGARKLVVVDSQQQGFINARTLAQVVGLNTVENATVLGTPFDVVNGVIGPGGTRAPTWPVVGPLDGVATLVQGRWPNPGEVIVSTSAVRELGLQHPLGWVASAEGQQQWAVVGSFTPKSGHDDLGNGTLTPAGVDDPGRELRVTLDAISSARATVAAVLAILDPPNSQGVHVESPTAIAQTARDLHAQLAGYGRSLLLMMLAGGAFFVAAVVLADVLVRRKDLGRRRTLGATRADLTALVTLRALIVATVGAALGCTAGWVVNQQQGSPTPVGFVVAIGVLTTLVAALAALPPAIYAALRDPVIVMRTS